MINAEELENVEVEVKLTGGQLINLIDNAIEVPYEIFDLDTDGTKEIAEKGFTKSDSLVVISLEGLEAIKPLLEVLPSSVYKINATEEIEMIEETLKGLPKD